MTNRNGLAGVLSLAMVLGFFVTGTPEAGAEAPSVTSKFEVSLYGYIKLDASYDTQRTAAGNLMFYVLPEGEGGKDDEFNMTARETRLGLNMRVPDLDDWTVTGKVEADFYSGASENSPNPRLRLAYVDATSGNWSVRAGQDWETFINTVPRIVNFSFLADAGAIGLRRPQLRVTRVMPLTDDTRLVAAVAAARTIGQDIDGGGQDDGAAAGYPTAQANLRLETKGIGGQRMVMGISGHWGTETVSSYVDESDPEAPVVVPEKDYDTWSVIGSLAVPLHERVILQGAIWRGENLDTYFGGIGQGINRQQQKGIAAQGGWAQFVLNPADKWNVNLGYGLDDPDSGDLNPGDRSKNELLFGSVFYSVGGGLTLAAEYSYMTTSYQDGQNAKNNRVQTSVIYHF